MTFARLLIAMIAIGCARHQPARTRHAALELHTCTVPDVKEPLQCGTLEVPEDRAHPERRRLALPVIVLPMLGRRERGVPLFELMGGPGAAATTAAVAFATDLKALRDTGDIVLIDQRGTGTGPASLACPELDDISADRVADAAALRRCENALAARADLRFYGTVEAARDLEQARIALGYERINIEALSYGTRLAQVYMRMFPSRVHAAVLFGTMPPDAHVPEDFAETAQRVVDAILEDCAREPECRRAHPKLREQFASLAVPSRIDRTAFTEWLRHRLYSSQGAAQLPTTIAATAAGDFSAFEGAPQLGKGLRNALNLTITCSEDVPAIDVPAAVARSRKTWFGAGRLERQVATCADWPRVPVPRELYEPVATDVTVLAIAGERDPVTPPSYAERAIKRMRNAQLIRVPGMAHEPDVAVDCLIAIERAFLREPMKRVDASCLATAALPHVH